MRALLLALLSAALFGASTPVSKLLLVDLTPPQLAGLLYLGAASGVGIKILLNRDGIFGGRIDARNVLRLAGAVLFGGVLGPLFLMKGLRLASAGSVSLWLNLEMVATALLGHMFFRDYLGRWGWMGAALIGAASMTLSWGEGSAGWQAGIFLALACLCWGLDNHWTALIDGLSPLQSTFWKGLVAGGTNFGIGLFLERLTAPPESIGLAIVAGALAYGASISLYITAAQALGASRSQMVFASAPFIGFTLSWTFLGEPLNALHGIAAVLQILGLISLFRERHSHHHVHEAMDHAHVHTHDDGHHDHLHPGTPASLRHSHRHAHKPIAHAHPHWPDLHHRHPHPRT